MSISLRHFPASPPSRTALAAANVVGVDVNVEIVDLFAKEQLKEEFVKINPQNTVPTIDDNGFTLCDSHAIATYFVSQYGKGDSLYPKEAKKKAFVDQRLYFEAGSLFVHMREIVVAGSEVEILLNCLQGHLTQIPLIVSSGVSEVSCVWDPQWIQRYS